MKPKYQLVHEFYGKVMRGRFCYTKEEAENLAAQVEEVYEQYGFAGKVYYVKIN